MDKENIYEYILGQKQLIEMECLKINTQLQIDSIFPENITQLIEQINDQHKNKTLELEYLNNELANEEAERKKKKKIQTNKMFLSFEDIVEILSSYDDGIYGVINYYKINKTINETKANEMLIKYISDKKFEYYNKPAIVKKIIEKGKFTESATEDQYGFVFMYEKNDDDIVDLNKVYLLKNGDINFINKQSSDNSEKSDNDKDNDEDNQDDNDLIITKIYNFVSEKKIVLKEIIYESTFESASDEIDETLHSDKEKQKKQLEDDIKNLNENDDLARFESISIKKSDPEVALFIENIKKL